MSAPDRFVGLSVAETRAGLARRDFSATELAEAALWRIGRLDLAVRAFLEVTPELALDAARRIDDDLAAAPSGSLPEGAGPLLGLPMAYKDNMNLTGTHTTCASRMLEGYVSPFTATCVEKTLQAGAIPLGKLNMDEFAFGSSTETSAFHRTNNPWDLGRVPGGSSGGSAAAVAAGMVSATLGSDTGGSIRQPASFCGVVGFKPSYGMVSRYGVVAFGSSLDQVGPFTRSVADAAAVTDAISGYDIHDTTSQPLQARMAEHLDEGVAGMRIGYVPAFLDLDGLEAEMRQAVEGALERLAGLGAELVEVELPHAGAALAAYYTIGPAEAYSNLCRFDAVRYGWSSPGATSLTDLYGQSRSHGFGPEVVRRILLGCYLLAAGVYDQYYYPAQQVRTLITADFSQAFERCEALAIPVSPRTAFRFGEVSDPVSMYLSDIYTIPANIAGNGGLSLPLGLGQESGLPLGLQIIGPQLRDENIFRVAAALEAAYAVDCLAPLAQAGTEGAGLGLAAAGLTAAPAAPAPAAPAGPGSSPAAADEGAAR